jgi:hypothetical protein
MYDLGFIYVIFIAHCGIQKETTLTEVQQLTQHTRSVYRLRDDGQFHSSARHYYTCQNNCE